MISFSNKVIVNKFFLGFAILFYPCISFSDNTEYNLSIPIHESPYNIIKKNTSSIPVDKYGNPVCTDCGLVKDNAFKGCNIVVLDLASIDFKLAKKALEKKGFSIKLWEGVAPSPGDLKKVLKKSSQLWLISDRGQKLDKNHLTVIRQFFDTGKGLYVWGDNDPYYVDANYLTKFLFGIFMSGDVPGDSVVGIQTDKNQSGLVKDHFCL